MQAAFPGGRDLPDGSARSGKGALILTRSAEMPSKASRQTQGTPQQPEYSRDGRPLLLAFRTPPLRPAAPSGRPDAASGHPDTVSGRPDAASSTGCPLAFWPPGRHLFGRTPSG